MHLPRGPVFHSESDVQDTPDKYSEGMSGWLESVREEGFRTARLSEEFDNITRYQEFISGNHWNKRRASYKSKFSVNKVGKARIDLLAYLTDSRPSIGVSGNSKTVDEQAEMISSVMAHEWVAEDIDLDLISVTDIAMGAGTAFWKMGAGTPGLTRITPYGPDGVFPIQPGWHIQESTAVLNRTFKPLNYARQKFPMHAAGIDREATTPQISGGFSYGPPSNIPQTTWNRMSSGMQRLVGIPMSQIHGQSIFKSVEWQEVYVDDTSRNESLRDVIMRDPYLPLDKHNWWYVVQPGQRLYPRKRLVVYAGKKMVYDGPSPFWHGLYPFACLRLNPVYWNFWGLSVYRDLIPMNVAMNEIMAGVLDTVKRALNQTVVARRGTVPDAAWAAFFPDMPGAKLMMNPNSQVGNDVRYIDPPLLPQYVLDTLVKFLGPEFDRMSGLVDIASLAGKMQVPGGDTIEQMRDTMQAPIRLYGRYIEAFLRDAGIQAVSNIIQFYSLGRRMRILGADGVTFNDFDFDPKTITPAEENKFDHWKQFNFTVSPGSVHGGAKDRDKQVAMSLKQMGSISNKELLRRLDFKNIDAIEAERAEEMQAMAGIEQGGSQPRLTRGQRNAKAV